MLNHTGIVKMVDDSEIVNESADKEQIRNFIIKRMEEIKAIKVDKKLENHGGGSIYFTFNLEEDSKIKMNIYSYCDEVHKITNGFLGLEKFIFYGEYKKICKNGLSVSKKQLDEWCAEQIKINKEKAEAYKLKKMNEDFAEE